MILDPRRVVFTDKRAGLKNLTVAWVDDNGKQFWANAPRGADMTQLINVEELRTPYGCIGIYCEDGTEIWPADIKKTWVD